jgi:hypothetical protein
MDVFLSWSSDEDTFSYVDLAQFADDDGLLAQSEQFFKENPALVFNEQDMPGDPSIHDRVLGRWYAAHTLIVPAEWTRALPSLTLQERQEALTTISSMAELPEDWDGFGAASIPKRISAVASGIINSLPDEIPTPDVNANANGTVSLLWQNDVGRAHLEIGTKTYSCYVRPWNGKTRYQDGLVDEIASSKKNLLEAMYPELPSPDYVLGTFSPEHATEIERRSNSDS